MQKQKQKYLFESTAEVCKYKQKKNAKINQSINQSLMAEGKYCKELERDISA